MKNFIPLHILSVILICCAVSAEYSEISEIQKFFDHLEKIRYNVKIAPQGNGGYGSSIDLYTTMYIIDIYKVDVNSKDYEVTFYFRQKWNDSRLAYPDLDLNEPITIRDESIIWTPDLFFVREKYGIRHQIMNPNKFIKILPSGEVHYSNRYTITFSCSMDFTKYPHDIQKCSFSSESYGYTVDRMNLLWDPKIEEPLMYNQEIDVLPYKILSIRNSENVVNFKGKHYKNLEVEIIFEGTMGAFVTIMYIPSVIIVIISWLTFWMSTKYRILRLTLLLVFMYFMVHITHDAKQMDPQVPYATGIDVWLGICNFMIFAALMEFIVVSMLKISSNRDKAICPEDPIQIHTEKDSKFTNSIPMGTAINVIGIRLKGTSEMHRQVDKASRIFFPAIFILFCFVYFLIY